ncbi:uncharacterized protein LOC109703947 isoform X4 [Ananas comosus]|uniref:Uncharacterized protein LOC109703947 isoform X4 n=1 Tax=Ananas comosus TaxID=4615 RepID=A0A6P5EF43_ANACO|nr:uncharacterized protein LOC109703947 isoform X4 [Ananas comosus]XP_020080283.1 uncharacterized protein LOC109703947 isoform X4 [Ananas comosus]
MVRWISLLIGVLNLGIVLLGGILLDSVVSGFSATAKILIATTTLIAGVRVAAMVGAARAQHAAAENIAGIWRTVPSPSTALFATRDGENMLMQGNMCFYFCYRESVQTY